MPKGMIFTLEARRERIAKASEILNNMLPCKYEKAMAVISLALGITEEKVREYIRIIKETENIVSLSGVLQKA